MPSAQQTGIPTAACFSTKGPRNRRGQSHRRRQSRPVRRPPPPRQMNSQSSWLIKAPVGQTCTHNPQRVHSSSIISIPQPRRKMASKAQTGTQAAHSRHRLALITIGWFSIFRTTICLCNHSNSMSISIHWLFPQIKIIGQSDAPG